MTPDSPVSLWPDSQALGTLTDLYELTMMAGYRSEEMADLPATFELFVRRMPPGRAFLVFAGLEQAIADLLELRFSAEQIDTLKQRNLVPNADPSVYDWLAGLRFKGDVHAVPEGSVVFPGEPLVRIEAPLAQAQWIESFLIASLCYPTMVASKAARMVEAARGRPLVDFGMRRAHGPQAGLLAARAAYLAGFDGTSHVEAALRLGIPAVGTMAHSWVQAFPTEAEAFEAYARIFPGSTTLLVDTYDTLEGVRRAALIEPPVEAVRLDSGDLGELARRARAILDGHDCRAVRIIASGDLDEGRVAALVDADAPIDGFGIGTELVTSRDAPAMSMVYKLVALNGQGRLKRSTGKATYPLAKQVDRLRDEMGRLTGDRIIAADEPVEGEPLLVPVIRGGTLAAPLPGLDAIRRHCLQQVADLPDSLHGIHARPDYPVSYSDRLIQEARRLIALS